ncbi:MAG: DUF4294 domain-containing protein [Chitinophagales bacterium]|nr:DUF4294 domain-containing protein [Chitinophagales bacterium]MDW8394422.1 DUF4294 domain-containing protein [Chitinophagales bacterium]
MQIVVILLLVAFSPSLFGQTEGKLLPLMVVGGDTVPVCTLHEVVVVSKRTFASQAEQQRFNQLRRNVLIVYPYAVEAARLFRSINDELAQLEKKKDRRKFLRQKERELDAMYSYTLRNMTVTQGDLLVKLIARETGVSVYTLIEELKNPVSAFYWDKASSFFGYSLKQQYDPQEMRDIELIVRSLEAGY